MESYIFNFNECQDLNLLEIGDQQCTPLYSFGPYIRNEYIFHYVLSGKGISLMHRPPALTIRSWQKYRAALRSMQEKAFCLSLTASIFTMRMRKNHGTIYGFFSKGYVFRSISGPAGLTTAPRSITPRITQPRPPPA